MKNLNTLVTQKNIVINYENQTFTISKSSDSDKYESIKSLLSQKDYDSIIDILVPKNKIIKYANKWFSVNDDGKMYMNDMPEEEMPFVLAKRLLDLISNNLDITSLVKFWINLRQNPSKESKKDLYAFLEKNNHAITPEGNFIAYKKVTDVKGIWKDSYTKTIDNSPGKIVEMPREKVDANRTNTCSAGLHVAAYKYASKYSGNILIEVVINPKDVVAVPPDYNQEKMRVCKYKVLNKVIDVDNIKSKNIKERNEILALIPESADIKFENKTASNKSIIDLSNKTAKEIIDIVYTHAGIKITSNPKNKQKIIKDATSFLTINGYCVKAK